MALSLFQWIGIGLAIAIVLIPIARWFWKRFDLPSKFALETIRRQKQEDEEAEMWAGIEAQVQAAEDEKRKSEIKRMERETAAGWSLDEGESAAAWNKLGIDAPVQPVERVIAAAIVEEQETEVIELTLENALKSGNPDEPDWELIEKMSNLDKPTEGVPEAPDLDELTETE